MRMTAGRQLLLVVLVAGLLLSVRYCARQMLPLTQFRHPYTPGVEAPSQGSILEGMQEYRYFSSDGGPFVLMSSELRREWKGVGVRSLFNPLDRKTDYGKACAVTSDFGVVNVRNGQCLVVNADLIALDANTPDDYLCIYLLKSLKNTNLDAMIDQCIKQCENSSFANSASTIEFSTDRLTFMWAGDVYGDCVYSFTDLNLPSGGYEISTADWHDPNAGHVLIVRLTRYSPP